MSGTLDAPPRWMKWFQLVPWLLIPLIMGATSYIASRVESGAYAAEARYREEFVLQKQYEADERANDYQRDQLEKRLERIDKKLDELIARKK